MNNLRFPNWRLTVFPDLPPSWFPGLELSGVIPRLFSDSTGGFAYI